MKKFVKTTLRLHAVLLVILLTGCNRSSVLPAESSTEESQAVEVATENESQTTEITTEAETQLVMVDVEGKTIRFGDVVIPWYLDAPYPTDYNGSPYHLHLIGNIPKEYQNLAVKVPLTYEAEVDGLSFHIDFFQEYYPLGSLIQAKITVHNGTGKSFEYYRNSGSIGYIKGIKEGASTGINHLLITEEDGEIITEIIYLKTFPKDETFVFERAFPARSDFFELGEEYSFSVSIGEMNSHFQNVQTYVLTFPIEVVAID